MKLNLGTVSTGIAGAVAGAVAGNTGMVVMNADQVAAMPWWGVLISNVLYAGCPASALIGPKWLN
jgi:predicted P-loop ATPase/GTPase